MHVSIGTPVKPNDIVVNSDDECWVVSNPIGREPSHPCSSGRVYVEHQHTSDDIWTREFFPGVFNMQWVDE